MRALRSLMWTVSFLTIIPGGRSAYGPPPSMGWIGFWFPFVGLGIGVLVSGALAGGFLLFGLWHRLPEDPAMLLALGFYVALTRGLHLDGLADTVDGLLGAPDREKRLAIMRDSRIGTFGVLALVFVLAVKFVGLVALVGIVARLTWKITLLPLVLGTSAVLAPMPMVGRWAMVFTAAMSRYAREGPGAGKEFCALMRPAHFVLASLMPVAVLVALFGPAAAILGGVALGVCFGLTALSWRMIGGATGDTIGAVGELTEVVYLLTVLVVLASGTSLFKPLVAWM
jgi:adenosylcobinamide-GDP ribazoletransferase